MILLPYHLTNDHLTLNITFIIEIMITKILTASTYTIVKLISNYNNQIYDNLINQNSEMHTILKQTV